MTKVSVIVPVYNVEKYLSRCFDSIINQSYKDIELILVNDGSTDNSGKICDEYAKKDNRVKVFHQENGGVTSARRLGVEESTGSYIMFVDSDDSMPDGAIEKAYEVLIEENVDIVTGITRNIYPQKTVAKNFGKEHVLDGNTFLLKLTQYKVSGTPCGRLYKRSLFDSSTLNIPREITNNEDRIMNIFVATKVKKVGFYNIPMHDYYQREDSARFNQLEFEYWEYFFEYAKKNIFIEQNELSIDDYYRFILSRLYIEYRKKNRANINYDFNVIIEIKKSKVIKGLNFKQKIALFFIKYHSLYVVKPFIYLINKVKYI